MTTRTRIDQPIWSPEPAQVRATRMHQFSQFVGNRSGLRLDTYGALWRWSIENREAFWSAIWSFFGVGGLPGHNVVGDCGRLARARWVSEGRFDILPEPPGGGAVGGPSATVVLGGDQDFP